MIKVFLYIFSVFKLADFSTNEPNFNSVQHCLLCMDFANQEGPFLLEYDQNKYLFAALADKLYFLKTGFHYFYFLPQHGSATCFYIIQVPEYYCGKKESYFSFYLLVFELALNSLFVADCKICSDYWIYFDTGFDSVDGSGVVDNKIHSYQVDIDSPDNNQGNIAVDIDWDSCLSSG